jgi:hypothetical protein
MFPFSKIPKKGWHGMNVAWPDGKQFAFSIFDDTDEMTLDTGRRVYGFLDQCGFRTTKSCWTFKGDPLQGKFPGATLDDDDYRQWLLDLESRGFEIGWHNTTWHSSPRERTAAALERFAEVFHHYPASAANHTGVAEGIYWGDRRLNGWHRVLYNFLTRYHNHKKYRGHVETDEHFWGDLCRQKIKYYRNFCFRDVDTLSACPMMPYHDSLMPYVNHWFASSDGRNVDAFNRCLSEASQDRLEAAGSACIMYTHFSARFDQGGRLDGRFEELMQRLSRKNGWFVPVATLLDWLLARNGQREISDAERRRLERSWLLEKIFIGTT